MKTTRSDGTPLFLTTRISLNAIDTTVSRASGTYVHADNGKKNKKKKR